MKTVMILMLVSFYSFIALCHSSNALNIAYLKSYSLSPVPNYTLTAPPTDTTSLTDGKYTRGYFWTHKSTVGWQDVKTVTILIDLGRVANIDAITFHTARGNAAGVDYPAQVDAFIGSDMEHFSYAGDVAKGPDNVPGSYKVNKFALRGIGKKGRYVLLEVVPKGKFLFCDEIEVLEGANAKTEPTTLSVNGTPAITIDEARNFTEQLRRLNIERVFLISLADKIKTTTPASPESAGRLASIEQKIAMLTTLSDTDAVEADLFKLRSQLLRDRFPGKDFLIESVNPWGNLALVQSLADAPPGNISISMPQGGYGHAAFMVTNLLPETMQITIQSGKLPAAAPGLTVYSVPFVKSATMEYVADPVVPIVTSLALRSGESRMVFMTAYGRQPGTWQSYLKIVGGRQTNKLPLDLQVANIALSPNPSLNSINWGYLDFKLIKDRKAEAVADLMAHHTNVAVVPSRYIPYADQPSPTDLIRLDKYLEQQKDASKILFFLSFNSENLANAQGRYRFMSDEWKEWFKKLHRRLARSAERVGISESHLYLYPFDEMKGKEIERFINLSTWARKAIPGIKFYATLDNKAALAALPFLDVAQIIDREDLYADAMRSRKEIWLYGAAENTKSLSPYAYYRMMSWKAYYMGFTGAGFWNYADTGSGDSPGTAWEDFDGVRPDFAVIYEGENGTIVSSRRWEAWRMGVEDYELLTMYARSKGVVAAKSLAKMVLDNPRDVGKADEVRRRILLELSR